MYEPQPLRAPADSAVSVLASHAWERRLTVYAGAGISAAPPTGLPGAARLARLVAEALDGQIVLGPVNRDDLLAVADLVEAGDLGAQLLRRTILEVADFRGADPNYAHAVLGLLLCEGATTVFETNYDDCIERAAQPDQPVVVRTADELIGASGACLLKAHGCATRSQTMLVSTADLQQVPGWADALVQAHLFRDLVLFLGLGSPADYVKDSVTNAVNEIGDDHVLLVDPALASWETDVNNPWRVLLGDLTAEHRDSRTAEDFCDALLRAYLHRPRRDARHLVSTMSPAHAQRRGLELVLSELESKDGVTVLRWLRSAAYKLRPGMATVTAPDTVAALLATGALVGESSATALHHGGWFIVTGPNSDETDDTGGRATAPTPAGDPGGPTPEPPETWVLLVVSHGTTRGTEVSTEAQRRVANARRSGLVTGDRPVVVLAVGHMGPMSEETDVQLGHRLTDVLATGAASSATALPEDIVEDQASEHLIGGISSGPLILVDARRLIEAA